MPALRPRNRPRSPCSASQTTSPLSSVLTQRKRESAAWRFPLLDPADVFACHLRCSFQLLPVRNSFIPCPPNGSPLSGDCLQPERLSPPISRASSAATSLRNLWARQDVQVSIYTSTLKVEYEETALAFYTIAWHEDNKHITEVSHPRVIETSYRSPQLTLWTLGPDEWLLFKKLPDYAPCTGRKTGDGAIIQLPLPDSDESQKPPASSS